MNTNPGHLAAKLQGKLAVEGPPLSGGFVKRKPKDRKEVVPIYNDAYASTNEDPTAVAVKPLRLLKSSGKATAKPFVSGPPPPPPLSSKPKKRTTTLPKGSHTPRPQTTSKAAKKAMEDVEAASCTAMPSSRGEQCPERSRLQCLPASPFPMLDLRGLTQGARKEEEKGAPGKSLQRGRKTVQSPHRPRARAGVGGECPSSARAIAGTALEGRQIAEKNGEEKKEGKAARVNGLASTPRDPVGPASARTGPILSEEWARSLIDPKDEYLLYQQTNDDDDDHLRARRHFLRPSSTGRVLGGSYQLNIQQLLEEKARREQSLGLLAERRRRLQGGGPLARETFSPSATTSLDFRRSLPPEQGPVEADLPAPVDPANGPSTARSRSLEGSSPRLSARLFKHHHHPRHPSSELTPWAFSGSKAGALGGSTQALMEAQEAAAREVIQANAKFINERRTPMLFQRPAYQFFLGVVKKAGERGVLPVEEDPTPLTSAHRSTNRNNNEGGGEESGAAEDGGFLRKEHHLARARSPRSSDCSAPPTRIYEGVLASPAGQTTFFSALSPHKGGYFAFDGDPEDAGILQKPLFCIASEENYERLVLQELESSARRQLQKHWLVSPRTRLTAPSLRADVESDEDSYDEAVSLLLNSPSRLSTVRAQDENPTPTIEDKQEAMGTAGSGEEENNAPPSFSVSFARTEGVADAVEEAAEAQPRKGPPPEPSLGFSKPADRPPIAAPGASEMSPPEKAHRKHPTGKKQLIKGDKTASTAECLLGDNGANNNSSSSSHSTRLHHITLTAAPPSSVAPNNNINHTTTTITTTTTTTTLITAVSTRSRFFTESKEVAPPETITTVRRLSPVRSPVRLDEPVSPTPKKEEDKKEEEFLTNLARISSPTRVEPTQSSPDKTGALRMELPLLTLPSSSSGGGGGRVDNTAIEKTLGESSTCSSLDDTYLAELYDFITAYETHLRGGGDERGPPPVERANSAFSNNENKQNKRKALEQRLSARFLRELRQNMGLNEAFNASLSGLDSEKEKGEELKSPSGKGRPRTPSSPREESSLSTLDDCSHHADNLQYALDAFGCLWRTNGVFGVVFPPLPEGLFQAEKGPKAVPWSCGAFVPFRGKEPHTRDLPCPTLNSTDAETQVQLIPCIQALGLSFTN